MLSISQRLIDPVFNNFGRYVVRSCIEFLVWPYIILEYKLHLVKVLSVFRFILLVLLQVGSVDSLASGIH